MHTLCCLEYEGGREEVKGKGGERERGEGEEKGEGEELRCKPKAMLVPTHRPLVAAYNQLVSQTLIIDNHTVTD